MTFATTLSPVVGVVCSGFVRRFVFLSALLISFAAIPINTVFAQIIFGNGAESMIFTISGTIISESSDNQGSNAPYPIGPHYPPTVGEQFKIVLNTKDYNHNVYWTTLVGQAPIRSRLDASSTGFSISLSERYGPPDYSFNLNLATSDSAFNPRTVGLTEYSGSYFDLTNAGGFHDSGFLPYVASVNIGFRVDNLSVFYIDPLLLPTVTTSAGVTLFAEELTSTPIAIDPLLTVALGVPTAPSAAVSVTTHFLPAEDVLGFANDGTTMGNISAAYDGTTGKLTLASSGGTATIAQWQAALRAVSYLNASPIPTPVDRTISFIINDGTVDSVPSAKVVSVEAINNPPTDLTLSSSTVYREEGVNATVGTLRTFDLDSASFTYSLTTGSGSTDNSRFNIQSSTLRANDAGSLVAGSYSVRIKTDDGSGGTFTKALVITVAEQRPAGVTSVAAGQDFTLFVKSDGTLWGMGSNAKGQLGDGTVTNRGTPILIATDVATTAAGSKHSLFVKNDGTLWAMGYNATGQLGDGTTTERHVPVQVAAGVVSVAAGNTHTLFLKSNGTLWAMGSNLNGQLGDWTLTDRQTPVQVADHVVSIAAGDSLSAFVRTDGSLWIPGPGVSVPLATQVAGVAQGFNHTMFIKLDGTLWGWAGNAKGELGDGTIQDRSVPVQVPGVNGVKTVTAGYEYTMFVKTDGTMWGMGRNTFGVLGDGTFGDRSTPVQVQEGVATASAGVSHLMFTTIDGALWGVGESADGELGDGLGHDFRAAPVLVLDGPLITTQPLSQTKVAGSSVTFTVTASGTPNPTFQWKKDGVAIGAATNSNSYTIAAVTAGDAGNYTVVVANLVGSATSDVAVLVVDPAPVAPLITTQPLSLTKVVGSSVTFTVCASGTPSPTFQWKKDGAAIGAATSDNSYTIAAVTAGDAGSYTVVAGNSAGVATSNPAVLTVNPAPVAPVITTQPSSKTSTVGGSVTLIVTANGVPTPTFQWKKGGVAISGATNSTYVIANVTAGDAGNYTAVATNSVDSATSNIATLTVNPLPVAPVITTQPSSQTVTDGSTATFLVAASGTPVPTYQWERNGVPIGGATASSYTLAAVSAGDAGNYAVVASNSAGFVKSDNAVLAVQPKGELWSKVLGDFDGNGKADLVWTNTITGERSMWFLNGNVLNGGASLGTVPVAWVVSATADFDGDGKADIFWTNTVTGDRTVWLMNGSTMRSNTFMGTVPVDWTISGTGDFNGDGKADLVWTNTTTGDRSMWLMNGSTVIGGGYLGTVPVAWTISGVGDFNGDGKADLVWTNTITGERSIWFQNGSTTISGATLNTVPVAWTISSVDDFNGDGKADIFLTNTITGDRVIWLMNGSAITTNAFMGTVPLEWTVSGTGDFDGDKKKDLFWTNTLTGDRTMWLMNGSTVLGGGFMGTVPPVWKIN